MAESGLTARFDFGTICQALEMRLRSEKREPGRSVRLRSTVGARWPEFLISSSSLASALAVDRKHMSQIMNSTAPPLRARHCLMCGYRPVWGMAKRSEGRETWHRLLEWDKGQAASERLAGHVLRLEGFESIDPSHPLGGPDGGKDFFAVRNGKKWTGAVFFPRGRKSFSQTRSKFTSDTERSLKGNSEGLIFITNQELTIGEREALAQINPLVSVEIFHLERIASLLDSPAAYGIRLEFLEIEMTKEDQISFFH